jgi:cysteine-S-conjugate beta-lyase
MAFDFDRTIERRGTGSEKWMPYEGADVLPLWVADMDFASPPEVIEALAEKVRHGVFGYAQPTPALVETVVDMCERRYRWKIAPEWIVWLPGLVSGLNVVCRAIGEAGDAVLTCTPVYPPFLTAPRNMGRETVAVPLACDGNRWEMDWEAMEKAVTPRTRLFLLCHPHNPVGRVFREEELARLADFCLRREIAICSDEIHCDLILDDLPHRPMASVSPEIADQTITLMAPSKTYNIPGLGCSFAIVPNHALRARFKRAAQGIVPQVNLFGLAGCEAAYRHGESWLRELIVYLRGNRDRVFDFVREELPGVNTTHVEATYLAWLNVSALRLADPAAWFEQAGVALSDGRFFGAEGYVRLNFGCPRSTLDQALERISQAVRKRACAAVDG